MAADIVWHARQLYLPLWLGQFLNPYPSPIPPLGQASGRFLQNFFLEVLSTGFFAGRHCIRVARLGVACSETH